MKPAQDRQRKSLLESDLAGSLGNAPAEARTRERDEAWLLGFPTRCAAAAAREPEQRRRASSG